MRYTDAITFVRQPQNHYDPELGEDVSDPAVKVERYARITKPVKDRNEQLISNQKVNQKVVHMKQPFLDAYDYALIDNKKFFFLNQTITGSRQIIYMRGDE